MAMFTAFSFSFKENPLCFWKSVFVSKYKLTISVLYNLAEFYPRNNYILFALTGFTIYHSLLGTVLVYAFGSQLSHFG